MIFDVIDFLQKTKENKSTWGIIVVKSNSFVHFLEEIDDPKSHFEINWPLELPTLQYVLCIKKETLSYLLQFIFMTLDTLS